MSGLLLLGAAAFIAYAIYTQYSKTNVGEPVPKRVWASVLAAGAALSSAVWSYLSSGGVTP